MGSGKLYKAKKERAVVGPGSWYGKTDSRYRVGWFVLSCSPANLRIRNVALQRKKSTVYRIFDINQLLPFECQFNVSSYYLLGAGQHSAMVSILASGPDRAAQRSIPSLSEVDQRRW